jgi:uncharacterized protein
VTPTRILPRVAGLGLCAGLGLAAYGAWEARAYTLREVTVPTLPPGSADLRVLHLSDIHMAPDQRAKQEWLAGLASLRPDLVINTGDNLAHRRSVPVVLEALGDLLDVPGAYVLGSNDYFSPTLRNPMRYLLPDDGRRHTDVPQLPWPDLKEGFDGGGWLDLTNGFGSLTVKGTTISFAGVDDPHLEYDDLDRVAGPADPDADLRLAVCHAPYLRVLDQFARDGYDAIIAGHTHGGQVCLPGGRALTTNCDLDRGRARGLHRHPAGSAPGSPGSAWLHVSAGLGTNPYVRVRVACRPEATLMTLVPRS